MPWRVKRMALLIALGFVAIALGSVVLVRERFADTRLLAIIAIAGGLAMVLVALPTNGHDD